jgi:hypothetical protein
MILGSIARSGEITEIIGRLSSGRTSLLMSVLQRATGAGAATALVDADDVFDADSAQRAGVVLERLLWVRCGGRRDHALRAADLLVRCPGFAVVGLDLGELTPRVSLSAAFRLRVAARRSRVALVVLSSRRVAGAGAALAVETTQIGVDWTGPARAVTRLAGLHTRVTVMRDRFTPMRSVSDVEWQCEVSS